MSGNANKLEEIIGYEGAKARYKNMDAFKEDLYALGGDFGGRNAAIIPDYLGSGEVVLHYSELYDGRVVVTQPPSKG